MWTNLLFAAIGILGGASVAGGAVALVVKVGVFTRLFEMTRTAAHIRLIETCLILGCIVGNLWSFFVLDFHIGTVGLLLFGSFCGMFVGWLFMALAETLSVIPIMFRRLRLKYGLGCVVLCMGIGKMIGSLYYFISDFGK